MSSMGEIEDEGRAQKEESEWDEEKEAYLSLADEMNDVDIPPWNEDDWDEDAVKAGKEYAKKNGLRWPPGHGDFDRAYEREHN